MEYEMNNIKKIKSKQKKNNVYFFNKKDNINKSLVILENEEKDEKNLLKSLKTRERYSAIEILNI